MTTRYPNGVTTASLNSAFSDFILPDETQAHIYYTDFDIYDTSEWDINLVGSPVPALIAQDGGWLDTNPTGVMAIAANHQSVAALFNLEQNKQTWFKAQIETGPDNILEWAVGLQPDNSTAPTTKPNQGIWFQKGTGQSNIAFHVRNVGIPGGFIDIVSDARLDIPFTLGFHFDGIDTYRAYLDNQLAAVFVSPEEIVPADLLRTTFAFISDESDSLLVDYIIVAQER